MIGKEWILVKHIGTSFRSPSCTEYLAFVTYVSLLKHAPVGPAYAAAHGHIASVLLISIIFLGERLTALQAVGAMVIFVGVAILAVTESGEGATTDQD